MGGGTIVVGGSQGVVVKYELTDDMEDDGDHDKASVRPLVSVQAHVGPCLSLSCDASGDLCATGGEDKLLRVWSLATPPRPSISSSAASPANSRMSMFQKGMPPAPLRQAAAPQLPPSIGFEAVPDATAARLLDSFSCASSVHGVALDASGIVLAVGLSAHTEVYRLRWSAPPAGGALDGSGGSGALSLGSEEAPNQALASVGVEHEPLLYLADAAALQGAVALSAGGGTLIVGGRQLVSIFDVDSGATTRRLPQDGRVRSVALSRDGTFAASGNFNKKATLLRIEHGTRLLNCCKQGQGSEVRSVHMVPGMSLLAVGSDEGHIVRRTH